MPAAPAPRTAVARARLLAQGLIPGFGRQPDPAAAVRWMTMVQAQDLRQAFWALGTRCPSSTAAEVRHALDSGRIVRTWGARGTLMLLSPDTVEDLLDVTAPRMRAQAASIHRRSGITGDDVTALEPVALGACAGGATREQLLEAFRAAGQDTSGQRGYHLLFCLSLRRVVIQGPTIDGGSLRQLFVPFGEWVAGAGTRTRHDAGGQEGALARLVARYVRSHGPATDADAAWWLGMPLTPVRTVLARLAEGADGTRGSAEANGPSEANDVDGTDESGEAGRPRASVVRRVLDGTAYWMAAETADALDANPRGPGARSLLALPGFDEFILGYRDRTATLREEDAQLVVPGGNGMFRRTIVDGGATIGTWSVGGTPADPLQVPEPFGQVLASGRATSFDARAREYRRFWHG